MIIENIELKWLGHASFFIKTESEKIIYIDPYNINGREKADIILITHPHYDHCSLADINKIVKDGTIIVMSVGCQSKIAKLDKKIEMNIIEAGQTLEFWGVKIGAVPAYNINKEFHSRTEGWVGYVIKIENVIIYHAGDTDLIPEMEKLSKYKGQKFIALLPVGGTYTMGAEQAVEVASLIQPTLAVPMHWGAGVTGERSDAEEFVNLCWKKRIKAEILSKE